MDKIGNVTMDYQFYNGSDDYSDGDIENELLDLIKNENDVNKILKKDNRWPVLYHFSPVRQNILEWYMFHEGANVLEIGAGCGAITGVLCRKAQKVTSVELSKRRALIGAYRNQAYDNLKIIVGNFNDIKFEEKYDYITLIGVLEYADYFTNGQDSFVTFLSNIKKLLKPNGKLLIAIENKYGMKYFAGQAEDHTGVLFDGIEGYVGTESKVKTFEKDELKKVILDAGFANTAFYYPFPDYKLPTQIFSDEYLPKPEDVVCSLESYDNNRILLFDQTEAFASAIRANKFDFFSNSFFVEASVQKDELIPKVYSKFTKDRREEFQIETAIMRENDQYVAVKSPLNEKADAHIANMFDNYEKSIATESTTIQLCPAKKDGNKVYFEFINGPSFGDKLMDAVEQKNMSEFKAILSEYKSLLLEVAHAKKLDEEIDKINIDLTFDNIIMLGRNQYIILDYEWYSEQALSLKFIAYRAVYAFYMKYQKSVQKFISLDELFNEFAISDDDRERYNEANNRFIDKVYDSVEGYNKTLEKYHKKTFPFQGRGLSDNIDPVNAEEKDYIVIQSIFEVLEKNREVLPDIDKYFAVTKKLISQEQQKDSNNRELVFTTDTFKEELDECISQLINIAYLKRDIEENLRRDEGLPKFVKQLKHIAHKIIKK